MAQPLQTTNPFDRGYFGSEALKSFGFKSVGKNVEVARNSSIIGLQNISLGDNVRVDDNVIIAAASGSLRIGNYIHIAAGCYLGCSGGITMEDFSGLSQGVRVYSATDDYGGSSLTNPTVPARYLKLTVAPINLGRHVIIGSGSVILPGVSIGIGSSVGALSLVNKSLGSWFVHSGIPAKPIRPRSKQLLELEMELLAKEGRD
jgi:acetyltransferase-like isoleucine patch superfamily enzyme